MEDGMTDRHHVQVFGCTVRMFDRKTEAKEINLILTAMYTKCCVGVATLIRFGDVNGVGEDFSTKTYLRGLLDLPVR